MTLFKAVIAIRLSTEHFLGNEGIINPANLLFSNAGLIIRYADVPTLAEGQCEPLKKAIWHNCASFLKAMKILAVS